MDAINGRLKKNSVIDAIDKLTNCDSGDATWDQAVDLVKANGVAALTVANLEFESGSLIWARSSMSQEWLTEYVAQGYYECDPFLKNLTGENFQISAYGAALLGAQESSREEIALNLGLDDAGYGSLHGTRFGSRVDTSGRFVTLCFDKSKQAGTPDMEAIAVLSSLITTFVSAPQSPQDAGYMDVGVTMLSQREREVLGLLASGLQTARISEKLGVTDATVTKHFVTARAKLGASTREQALFIALKRGLIDL